MISKVKLNISKFLLYIYPPYLGSGIVVRKIAPDFRELVVQMKLRWYNRNYVGTHFGGSLYAMIDPFLMLMLFHILGKNYIVWDKSAAIDFIKPGKSTVTATFTIEDKDLKTILHHTSDGSKYLHEFQVQIVDSQGEVVAKVTKIVYVRKK